MNKNKVYNHSNKTYDSKKARRKEATIKKNIDLLIQYNQP